MKKSFPKQTAYLLWLALLTIGLLGNAPAGKAQTMSPTPSPAAPAAILPTTSPILSAAQPLAPGVEYSELTLANWNYEDVVLFGPSGFATYDIGLPMHWEMQPGGSLTLLVNYLAAYGRASATPGATDSVQDSVMIASVQVKLNSQPIYQTNLAELGPHTLEIKFPDSWPARTGERDHLQVYLHVYGPCDDVQYSSLQISKASIVRLIYSPGALALDLANYPAPFFQRTFLPSTAVLALPEKADASVYEAALAVAAGLGSRSNNRVNLSAMTDAEWNDAAPLREHAILVGTPDENQILGKLLTDEHNGLVARLREFELSASGPSTTAPDLPIDIVLKVTNPTTAPAAGLALVSRLPLEASKVECQGCTRHPAQAKWEIDTLAPNETREFQLRYSMPAGMEQRVGVINELLHDGQPVNVASMETQLVRGALPTQTTTKTTSNLFFIYRNHGVAETDGIIALIASPWQAGKALLVVTGLDNEAVWKAGRALSSHAAFPGMLGPVALVQAVNASAAVEDTQLEGAQPANEALIEDVTFAELGYDDMTVSGTGMKEIYYQFDLPLGWALTEEALLRIKYAHSPILNPDESAITLLYNGTPIASAALTADTAVSGELVGKLPPKRSLPGRANNLLARVTLMLPDPCADPESTQAWLRISPESNLHLSHYNQDLRGYLNMDSWPIPFAARADMGDVLFALPEKPAPLEAATAVQLASYLGAASGGDNFHPAVMLGSGEQADLGAYHLLAIGRPSRNPLLQRANPDLPQPFILGGDELLQQVDHVVFRLPDGLDLGILQSIPSPWSGERVFLAVTGTSDTGMLQASNFMIDSGRNWELKGNLAMLRDGKIAVADPQELTTRGLLNAVATAAPGAQVVGSAPPATPVAPAATPAFDASDVAPTPVPLSYPERYPFLLPLVISIGTLGILIIGATIYRQRRKDM